MKMTNLASHGREGEGDKVERVRKKMKVCAQSAGEKRKKK